MDVDNNYIKYGQRRRRDHNRVAVLGVMVCLASFTLGFAWVHYSAQETLRYLRLRRGASDTTKGVEAVQA